MTAPGQTYFLIKISLLIQHATSARLETDPTTSPSYAYCTRSKIILEGMLWYMHINLLT